MRRALFIPSVLLLLVISIIAFPASLHAADMSVGATTWYTSWDFDMEGNDDVTMSPGFLFGPVLSLTLTQDMSFSFVFLYGKFDQTDRSSGYKEVSEITRYDSDATLNYRISNNFKLFAGVKYIRFTFSNNGLHQAVGPGAGISTVFPVWDNFFILGYVSGMYLWGEEEFDASNGPIKASEYGGNASASLAYYIPATSTTISLGGRYQYVKIDYEKNSSFQMDNTSQFYGLTLTAVYTFNI